MSTTDHTGRVAAPTVPRHVKDAESARIAADIAAFKARGGKIEKLGITPIRGITKVSQNKKQKHKRPLEKGAA